MVKYADLDSINFRLVAFSESIYVTQPTNLRIIQVNTQKIKSTKGIFPILIRAFYFMIRFDARLTSFFSSFLFL